MIQSIKSYLPLQKLSNLDLEKEYKKWTADNIYEKTGIRQRSIASESETSLDLGEKAAHLLHEFQDGTVSNVDCVIFCTQFPDFPLPPNSTLLQNRLKIKTHSAAFDITHACSGYIYGLFLANNMLHAANMHSILFVTADTYTRHLAPTDFSSRTIFGDAGTATFFSKASTNRLYGFAFGTDGGYSAALMCERGGERDLIAKQSFAATNLDPQIRMNGPEVFNFTLRAVPEVIDRTCELAGIDLTEFDWIVFHQANLFMLEHLRKKLGIDKKRFVIDFEDCGNTVSSSIPIVLERLQKTGKLQQGNKVLLAGFGVGLSWGSCVLEIGRSQ